MGPAGCATVLDKNSDSHLSRDDSVSLYHKFTMARWSDNEDKELRALVQKNTINFQNTDPNYLFKVTQTYFPDFAGEGQTGRNTRCPTPPQEVSAAC
jgi:hypothetical protein